MTILAIQQIRHQATHNVGCQSSDYVISHFNLPQGFVWVSMGHHTHDHFITPKGMKHKRKCSPLQFVHYHTVVCVFVLVWVLKPVLACHMLCSHNSSSTSENGSYVQEYQKKYLHVFCLAQQISWKVLLVGFEAKDAHSVTNECCNCSCLSLLKCQQGCKVSTTMLQRSDDCPARRKQWEHKEEWLAMQLIKTCIKLCVKRLCRMLEVQTTKKRK